MVSGMDSNPLARSIGGMTPDTAPSLRDFFFARIASNSARGIFSRSGWAVTHAASAAKSITLDAHQLHGGMGYVVETDLHLFSERARVLSTL